MSEIIINEELINCVDLDQTIFYIQEIFKNVQEIDPAWMVELRRVGEYTLEDGTKQPADQTVCAQLAMFDPNNWQEGLARWVAEKVRVTAPIGIGAFICPALLNDRKANDKSVKQMVTMCADFDSGNPTELLKKAVECLRVKPTFIVHSGGYTAEGHMKLHVHWVLDEPCDEPWKVAYIREQFAKRFGADQSFKRIPQVIRIPGALYDKKGNWGTTKILEYNKTEISIMNLEEALNIDWNNIQEDSIFSKNHNNKTAEERSERMHQILTEEVSSGRNEDTRWDRFSEFAGHQIRQARFGNQTVEEAFKSVTIWVNDKMTPPWDPGRIESEFKALLNRDRVNSADQWDAMEGPKVVIGTPTPANNTVETQPSEIAGSKFAFKPFKASVLYAGEAPQERHLIDNFMVHGSSIALVADGGVGKTYVSLELAMKAAAGNIKIGNFPNNFMGFDVLEKMMVIVFTVEDGQHDIHRRLCAIDPDGSLRQASGDNCYIIPVQEQLLNGLTLVAKDSKGNLGPSDSWRFIIDQIAVLRNEEGEELPLLVIIDTYSATHHGDENNAVAVNEWFRAAGLVRKRFGATLFLTHHVRKSDPKEEIKTPSEMKASVRGSTAFLNSLRTVYGIWEMPNSDSVLKELPRDPGARLFNMGILKNNTGIDWSDRSDPRYPEPVITLIRLASGRLMYDGLAQLKRIELADKGGERLAASKRQLRASIIHAVRWYAAHGWPLSKNSFKDDKSKGIKSVLDGRMSSMSRNVVFDTINELLESKAILQIKIKKTSSMVFDVQDGPFSTLKMEQRTDVTPVMQWNGFKYDAENEEYIELENMQHVLDV